MGFMTQKREKRLKDEVDKRLMRWGIITQHKDLKTLGQAGTKGGYTIEIKLKLLDMFAPLERNSGRLIKSLKYKYSFSSMST